MGAERKKEFLWKLWGMQRFEAHDGIVSVMAIYGQMQNLAKPRQQRADEDNDEHN